MAVSRERWGTCLGKEVDRTGSYGIMVLVISKGSCRGFSRLGTGTWHIFRFEPEDDSYLTGIYLTAMEFNITWVMDSCES